jgi:hypothetical protein
MWMIGLLVPSLPLQYYVVNKQLPFSPKSNAKTQTLFSGVCHRHAIENKLATPTVCPASQSNNSLYQNVVTLRDFIVTKTLSRNTASNES